MRKWKIGAWEIEKLGDCRNSFHGLNFYIFNPNDFIVSFSLKAMM